jgi:hypothetical protein
MCGSREELEYALEERDLYDQESPEGEGVSSARTRSLEEFLLPEDLEDRVTRPAREQTLEPFGIRLTGADQLGQTPRARTRDGKDGDREDERRYESPNSVQNANLLGLRRAKGYRPDNVSCVL